MHRKPYQVPHLQTIFSELVGDIAKKTDSNLKKAYLYNASNLEHIQNANDATCINLMYQFPLHT